MILIVDIYFPYLLLKPHIYYNLNQMKLLTKINKIKIKSLGKNKKI